MNTKKRFTFLFTLILLIPFLATPLQQSYAVDKVLSGVQGVLEANGNSGKVTSYCTLGKDGLCSNFKYHCEEDGTAIMDSVVGGYGKVGSVLWTGSAPGCRKGIFTKAKYTSSDHLVECLSYYQIYRFYGKQSSFDQFISSSKVTPVNDCQNADTLGVNSTKARLANPNPSDGATMELGTPWNNLNIPVARITNKVKTENLISVASDSCGKDSKKAKDGGCAITTGKPTKLPGNEESCSSLYIPAADSVRSYINSPAKVQLDGKLVVLGDAVKNRIFGLIEPYLDDNTYSSANKLTSGWLPYSTLTGPNALPAAPSDIKALGNNLDCSSLLQYIPTLQPTALVEDKNNFTTCIVAVGTLADSYISDGDLYFQHHGPEILSGNYVQERYMGTTWTPTAMIGQNSLTSYSPIKASDVVAKSSKFENYLTSRDVNGNVDPDSITNDQSLNVATKGSDADKINSFKKFAKCYRVTMNTSVFTILEDVCPDGSAIPANGVCTAPKIICPDGSEKPAGGTCPVTPLTPSACTGNPCININLNTPKQFVVGGTLRPQKVTATATYSNIDKCGHFICRASSNAASNITLNLSSKASGGYTACNLPISNPKSPSGCSYTQVVTNSSGNNKAAIDYQFFSAANPGEKITITATAAGFYDYADQVQDPCIDRSVMRGSVLTTVCVFPPLRTVWTYNAPVSNFAQSPTGSSTVIGTVGS
jgi:hypothetical protein